MRATKRRTGTGYGLKGASFNRICTFEGQLKRRKVVEELGKLETDFSKTNARVQEFLGGRKDELSSVVTDVSLNTHRRHVEKSIKKKSELIAKDEIRSQVERFEREKAFRN